MFANCDLTAGQADQFCTTLSYHPSDKGHEGLRPKAHADEYRIEGVRDVLDVGRPSIFAWLGLRSVVLPSVSEAPGVRIVAAGAGAAVVVVVVVAAGAVVVAVAAAAAAVHPSAFAWPGMCVVARPSIFASTEMRAVVRPSISASPAELSGELRLHPDYMFEQAPFVLNCSPA